MKTLNTAQMKKKFYLIFLILILTSCQSIKYYYYYLDFKVPTNYKSIYNNVSIAFWDQREQIIKGKQKPNFTGFFRRDMYNGYDAKIRTESGNPLVDDILKSIANKLKINGSIINTVQTNYSENEQSVIQKLAAMHSSRFILFKFNEFYTDGKGQYKLYYDIDVKVYSSIGTIIKEKKYAEIKNIGEPNIEYRLSLIPKIRNAIEENFSNIFFDKDIISVLETSK